MHFTVGRVNEVKLMHFLVIFLALMALAIALGFVASGVAGLLENDEKADTCQEMGHVWLSGNGVSQHGCYDLTRVPVK